MKDEHKDLVEQIAVMAISAAVGKTISNVIMSNVIIKKPMEKAVIGLGTFVISSVLSDTIAESFVDNTKKTIATVLEGATANAKPKK